MADEDGEQALIDSSLHELDPADKVFLFDCIIANRRTEGAVGGKGKDYYFTPLVFSRAQVQNAAIAKGVLGKKPGDVKLRKLWKDVEKEVGDSYSSRQITPKGALLFESACARDQQAVQGPALEQRERSPSPIARIEIIQELPDYNWHDDSFDIELELSRVEEHVANLSFDDLPESVCAVSFIVSPGHVTQPVPHRVLSRGPAPPVKAIADVQGGPRRILAPSVTRVLRVPR